MRDFHSSIFLLLNFVPNDFPEDFALDSTPTRGLTLVVIREQGLRSPPNTRNIGSFRVGVKKVVVVTTKKQSSSLE